jgi:hypothetical protein
MKIEIEQIITDHFDRKLSLGEAVTKFCVYAMLAAGLSSCTGAFDSDSCMQAVQAEYPKAIVWKVPDKKYQFIVCDTCGAVYHVKTMDGNSTKITTKVVIKPCR